MFKLYHVNSFQGCHTHSVVLMDLTVLFVCFSLLNVFVLKSQSFTLSLSVSYLGFAFRGVTVCYQVLMSKSVLLALSPFALTCLLCAIGTALLPIETRGRALLVKNLINKLLSLL